VEAERLKPPADDRRAERRADGDHEDQPDQVTGPRGTGSATVRASQTR
jgi:hypothetical protein